MSGADVEQTVKEKRLEKILMEKGFVEIQKISLGHYANPVPGYQLRYLINDLLHETRERGTRVTDFAILPAKEATENETSSRNSYMVYVLLK